MISVDVKADVKQKIKELVAIFKEYLQNLKYNVKQVCFFHFNFAWYSIQLDIVR